ncbi:hypothetical protein [Jeongeupia chitinilytica]|uniref:Resolvase HTH domain-containing protein n=1 Tax=Jeongeupia chitinilytica TaxID=1041641 RepID=A0ABQ3H2A1_9NEIS|nr:hypothetical protein [Jeongeupia chitinilytica]GHD62825.1 hypothetical protein GCM10007350_19110 [Jeongeupia chitinilytica]
MLSTFTLSLGNTFARLAPGPFNRWIAEDFTSGLPQLAAKLKGALVESVGLPLDQNKQPQDPEQFEPAWTARLAQLQTYAAVVDTALAIAQTRLQDWLDDVNPEHDLPADQIYRLDVDETDSFYRVTQLDYVRKHLQPGGETLAELSDGDFDLIILACSLHDAELWRDAGQTDQAMSCMAFAAQVAALGTAAMMADEARQQIIEQRRQQNRSNAACSHGNKRGRQINVDPQAVIATRTALIAGGMPVRNTAAVLAKRFGCSASYIRSIVAADH